MLIKRMNIPISLTQIDVEITVKELMNLDENEQIVYDSKGYYINPDLKDILLQIYNGVSFHLLALRTMEKGLYRYEVLFGNKIICLIRDFILGKISIIGNHKRINLLDSDEKYLNHFLECKLRIKLYDIVLDDKRNNQIAKNHIKKILSILA